LAMTYLHFFSLEPGSDFLILTKPDYFTQSHMVQRLYLRLICHLVSLFLLGGYAEYLSFNFCL